ncbi:MAG: DUF4384 domain-containing protein [Pseudomonadota bacterium]
MKALLFSTFALAFALPMLAEAQSQRSNLRAVAAQSKTEGSGLNARMIVLPDERESTEYSLGDKVAICIKAQRKGYISVWSRTPDMSHMVRVFPNDYTPEGKAERGVLLEARSEKCIGRNDEFDLVVQEPLGDSEVYIHWTPSQDEQFAEEDIPEPLERGVTRGTGPNGYDSQTIKYTTLQ